MAIRVLQIIRTMNIGGAETFIMNVYRNIDRDKIQFDFLVNGEGIYDSEIRKLGGRIYKIPYLTEVGQFKYIKELKNFLDIHKEFKIVHSHIDQVSGIIVQTARLCNIPLIISHSHSTKNSNGIIGKIYKRYLQSKINKNTDIKMACGHDAAKWLYRGQDSDAIIVNNGIDVNKFKFKEEFRKEIRKEFNIDNNTIVVGHVGRFSKVKNHEFLIDVFNEYQKSIDSVLMLVGDGYLKDKIENKVFKLNLQDKVKFLGNRKDVYKVYSAFDVILFPSLYEGISIALIEAQCNGLKILASDTIDPKTDIIGNIYIESLKKLPEEWNSKLKKINMKRNENIKKIVENGYDINTVAKRIEKIYLEGAKK